MHVVTSSGDVVAVRATTVDRPRWYGNSRTTPSVGAIQLLANINGPAKYKRLWELYSTNPWLFATVDMLAVGVSRVDLEVHEPDENGDSSPVPVFAAQPQGSPDAARSLVNLIQEPTEGVDWQSWARDFTTQRKVYGNALAVIERPSPSAMPTALRIIPWPWVSVDVVDGVVLRYVVTYPTGRETTFVPSEVIHWGKTMSNREGLWGCSASPIEALEHTMRLYDAIARHLESFYKNSARLSGQLKIDGGNKNAATLKAELDMLQEGIKEFYSGPDQAGQVLVTTGTFQPISTDPKSAALVELKKLCREEIVAAYHVPPPLAGILESAIKSNVVELRSQYLRDVVGPDVQELVSVIMVQLVRKVPAWKSLRLRPNMDNPLRPDLEARATVYEKMRHVWTVQEMRGLEGLPPLKGAAGEYAETVWMPSGQVPLGLVQPQTQAQTYGALPLDSDGVGNVNKPVEASPSPQPPQEQKGGTDAQAPSGG